MTLPATASPDGSAPLTAGPLAAEFDTFMTRAGVAVPAEYRDSILAAYADFRAQLPVLHGPRTHLSEPAAVFSLVPAAAAAA